MQRTKSASFTTASSGNIVWEVIALAVLGGLLLVLLVEIGDWLPWLWPLRAVLGATYILFVPGFFLALALFPRVDDLDMIERAGLSFGLSIAIVPLLALLLDRLPWGIRLWPIVVAQTSVTALIIVLGALRSAWLPAGSAYQPTLRQRPRRWWRSLDGGSRRTYALLAGALLLAAMSIGWIFLAPAPGEFMTEFYILGKAGLAEDYPRQAKVGQDLNMTMGVTNHERNAQSYRVEVWAIDSWDATKRQLVAQRGPDTLAVGQAQQWPIAWRMPWAGPDQHVELLLYRAGEIQPYRQLRLWINVE